MFLLYSDICRKLYLISCNFYIFQTLGTKNVDHELTMTTVVTNTATEAQHTSQNPQHARNSTMNKSITRLLQHSILQLCNEHIGYTHKLQILGVLCMTVDDEQQELVVKVNNTLKRVGPANGKDGPHPFPPHGLPTGVQTLPHVPHLVNNVSTDLSLGSATHHHHHRDSLHSHPHPRGLSPTPSPLPLNMSGRKSHGRKGSNPTKVQQVIEENHIYSEDDDEDDEPLTIIPEAPEATSQMSSGASSPSLGSTPSSSSRFRGASGPSGSAKRKPSHQFRVPQYPSPSGSPYVRTLPPESVSGAYIQEPAAGGRGDEGSSLLDGSSSSSGSSSKPGLSLPIYVGGTYSQENHDLNEPINLAAGSSASKSASSPSTSRHNDSLHMNGRHSREGSPNSNLDPRSLNSDRPGSSSSSSVHNSLKVKDEPDEDSEGDYKEHLGSLEEYARANVAALFHGGDSLDPDARMEGLHSALPYPPMSMFLPRHGFDSPSSRESDGLTIKYTSTGPYTVGANGKDVSNSSRIKDIIMYDDQSPLSAQKGARIETDYIVDKLGLDGRKRRRRALEDLLTPEEIAEYLGQPERSDYSFKCKYCTEEFDSITRYIHHTLAAHQAYICHQCGKSFTTKSSLLRHRPIHTGMRRFACSICKKTFYRKDKCKAHIRRHLGVDDKGNSTMDTTSASVASNAQPPPPPPPPQSNSSQFPTNNLPSNNNNTPPSSNNNNNTSQFPTPVEAAASSTADSP